MHGDEPQSADVAAMLIEDLATQDHPQLVIVSHLNPDGLARGTRKNGRGVDLNRNFPTANWAASDLGDPYHGGDQPGSEVETQLLLDLYARYAPSRILAIHCIDGGRHCINYDGPAQQLAKTMSTLNGYAVSADIGYPTPGSMGTWAGRERSIPTITLEMPDDRPAVDCWADHREALLTFVNHEE
jgi:protein MpaA